MSSSTSSPRTSNSQYQVTEGETPRKSNSCVSSPGTFSPMARRAMRGSCYTPDRPTQDPSVRVRGTLFRSRFLNLKIRPKKKKIAVFGAPLLKKVWSVGRQQLFFYLFFFLLLLFYQKSVTDSRILVILGVGYLSLNNNSGCNWWIFNLFFAACSAEIVLFIKFLRQIEN